MRRGSSHARLAYAVALAGAAVAAAAGWSREATRLPASAAGIRIVQVRPLCAPDPALEDLTSHQFAVRVAVRGWKIHRYLPGAQARDNRTDGGQWRLYLDGQSLGDSFSSVAYVHYLWPGTHWLAAELSNVDHSSLEPPVWSEPVILHVPKHVTCRQRP